MPYGERYLGCDERLCFEAALSDAGREADRALVEDMVARYAKAAETGLRYFPGVTERLAALDAAGPWRFAPGPYEPRSTMPWAGWACTTGRRSSPRPRTRPDASPTPRATWEDPDRPPHERRWGSGRESVPGGVDSQGSVASAKAAGLWAVDVAHTCAPGRLRHACPDVILPRLADLTPGWVLDVLPPLEGTGWDGISPPPPTRPDSTWSPEARRAKAMCHE